MRHAEVVLDVWNVLELPIRVLHHANKVGLKPMHHACSLYDINSEMCMWTCVISSHIQSLESPGERIIN